MTHTKANDNPDFLYWTVRIGVHKSWVEDGFDLTPDNIDDKVRKLIPYAYGTESSGEVISAPDAKLITKLQSD